MPFVYWLLCHTQRNLPLPAFLSMINFKRCITFLLQRILLMLFLFSELQVFKEVNMRRAFILISAFLVFVLCLSSCDVNGGKPGEEQSGMGGGMSSLQSLHF